MAELKTVALTSIDHNPHRCVKTYPYDEAKLKSLAHSMEEVGCWEGIIARKAGRRYEAAFGHHRLKAAEMTGLAKVPVIIRDLSDEDMLRFMGRENGEDYRAIFLVLLETWDAAAQYFTDESVKSEKPMKIAREIGWTRVNSKSGSWMITDTASACNAAHQLLADGHLQRSDFEGLSVSQAQFLCERALSRMKTIKKAEKAGRVTEAEAESVARDVATGVKRTADNVRAGKVAQRDIRSEVDVEAHRAGAKRKKASPMFAVFGNALSSQIDRSFKKDTIGKHLTEVVRVLPKIEMQEDRETVDRLNFDLGQAVKRIEDWQKKLIVDKVTPIRPVAKQLAEDG